VTLSLQRFAEVVSADTFDLAQASLMVAQDAYPALEIDAYLRQLDEMAAAIRSRLPADAFPEQKVLALNFHLFNDQRFVGNIDDYYDPRNSYLNEVLERRTGIPITLSIIYMEVGRRLGLNLAGLSFPGHFLIKLKVKRGQLVLDPFMGGEAQSEAQLLERLAKVMPAEEASKRGIEPYLEPATSRQVIARLLRNLKNIYLRERNSPKALAVMQRMVLVAPESAEELRDRGLLYQELECFRPALADLEGYVRKRRSAPDSADIQARITELKRACARMN
jgi:regulator of sirC expression with transglutaminase-like and TPR domain